MTVENITGSLADVIDTVVEEFVANAEGPFDQRQVEIQILGTPEFRRVRDVQMKYLGDTDIESPIMDYMKDRVCYALQKMRNDHGEQALQAVPSEGSDGHYT